MDPVPSDEGVTTDLESCDMAVGGETLSLSYEESFTLETLAGLIEAHEDVGKRFILAEVRTRQRENGMSSLSHFYAAHHLNKLLFKKRDEELIHRYHSQYAMQVLNPLNNSDIVGEVSYYVCTTNTTHDEESGSTSPAASEFIGTDYNYAHSEKLRDLFEKNALEQHLNHLMQDTAHPTPDIPTDAAVDVFSSLQRLSALAERVERSGNVIEVPFGKAVALGVAATLYGLISFFIFSMALYHLIKQDGQGEQRWFWSFLPFFSFLTDRTICSVFLEEEPRVWMSACLANSPAHSAAKMVSIVKVGSWALYLLLPVMLFKHSTPEYHLTRNIFDCVFPCVFTNYSLILFCYLNKKKRLI